MDREKAIKGFECCMTDMNRSDSMPCRLCPYGTLPKKENCQKRMFADVLALLKEQEAVEPSFKQDEKGIFVWCCGSCGAYMYHIYDGIDKAKEYAKFCRQCGRPVKWNENISIMEKERANN